MQHVELRKLENAHYSYVDAVKINEAFLESAKKNPEHIDVPSKLEFSDHGIAIQCFGYTAEAIPRFVLSDKHGFMVEYVFNIKEVGIEVWRFYLTYDGEIVGASDGSGPVCDIGSNHIARQICGRVLLGALNSGIYTPSLKTDTPSI
jgi:hypothetical protein